MPHKSAFNFHTHMGRAPVRAVLFEKLPEIINLFRGLGVQRQRYLEVVVRYLKYVVPKGKRVEFSKIVERELKLGDDEMKKSSNIWAELGYYAGKDDGLKEGESIGFSKGKRKGEEIGFNKGERKGEEIGFSKGERKGEEIGFKKGIQHEQKLEERKNRTTALKMLRKGIPVEDICDFTGLSIEKVLELKKRIKIK